MNSIMIPSSDSNPNSTEIFKYDKIYADLVLNS